MTQGVVTFVRFLLVINNLCKEFQTKYNVYTVYTNGICKKLKSYSSAKKEPSRALRTIACGKVDKLELPLPKKVKFSDQ